MTTDLALADDRRQTVIYESLRGRFPAIVVPDWYDDAVMWLRGGADAGFFGLYLYNLLLERDDIRTVVNIGTARGHSTVCLAKGLVDGEGEGTVHTIDIIDPREPRDWHVAKQATTDPARDQALTMAELVSRFHDPEGDHVPVTFHQGDATRVLSTHDLGPIDLVFHDGLHTYTSVSSAIEATSSTDRAPIHVFDDCYLHRRQDVRVFDHLLPQRLDAVPLVRNYARRLRSWSVSKTRYPGVTRAVGEAYASGRWGRIEIVDDEDHAPITTLLP